jgi:hypothetical protein
MVRPIAGFDQLASRAGDTLGLLEEQQNRQDWAMAKNAAQAWGNAKAGQLQAEATEAQAQGNMWSSIIGGVGRLGGAVAGQLGAAGGGMGGNQGGGDPSSFDGSAASWKTGFSLPSDTFSMPNVYTPPAYDPTW